MRRKDSTCERGVIEVCWSEICWSEICWIDEEMAQKRKHFEVSEMEEEDNATIHGVVVEVSPVRPSRNNPNVKLFSGKVSDGVKVARVISFEPKLHPSFSKSREEGKSVALVNCKVQEGKFSDGALEIVASKHTRVESSPKKFKMDTVNFSKEGDSAVEVKVEEVAKLAVNQHITVVGKVVKVGVAGEVTSKHYNKQLMKQECIVGDRNGSCRIVLWEKEIGKLHEGKSYRLHKVLVRQYGGVNYLSMCEGAEVEEIADIGEVVSDEEGEERGEEGQHVAEGEIIAVLCVDEYPNCVSCKGKINAVSDVMGECMKCRAKVKLSRCGKSIRAKFMVEGVEKKSWCLTAFNDEVEAMVSGESGESTEEKMLSAPVMKFIITSTNVVMRVSKTQ